MEETQVIHKMQLSCAQQLVGSKNTLKLISLLQLNGGGSWKFIILDLQVSAIDMDEVGWLVLTRVQIEIVRNIIKKFQ
jgi:hypothetical protein